MGGRSEDETGRERVQGRSERRRGKDAAGKFGGMGMTRRELAGTVKGARRSLEHGEARPDEGVGDRKVERQDLHDEDVNIKQTGMCERGEVGWGEDKLVKRKRQKVLSI